MKKILFTALLTVGIAFSALNALAGQDNRGSRLQQNRDGTPNTAITHDPVNRYDQRPASEPRTPTETRIPAQDMSTAGLLAASAIAAGIYAIRRRAKSRT
jgi:hypothetical protein